MPMYEMVGWFGRKYTYEGSELVFRGFIKNDKNAIDTAVRLVESTYHGIFIVKGLGDVKPIMAEVVRSDYGIIEIKDYRS